MHIISRSAGFPASWARCLLLALLLLSPAWSAVSSSVTGPNDASVAIGDTVVLSSTAAGLGDGGDSCVWYRNGVVVTAGTSKVPATSKVAAMWRITFIATAQENNAKYHCIITGKDKNQALMDLQSPEATITVVAGNAPFKLIKPVVATTITADVTTNPPGIQFFSSRPVATWEVNFPTTDAVFRSFGDAVPGDTSNVLPLPLLFATSKALKIRITSATSEVFTGDYTLGAQQIAPITLAPAIFGPPFYVAFYGTPFAVDQQHGLGRFIRDPNGDTVTFTKTAGTGLTINANGSFTWSTPAAPVGLSFPSAVQQSQLVVAGSYTATDGINPAVGPLEIKVVVLANPGDLNRDGVVNIQDVQQVLSKFGQNPGVPTDP